ncbi:MAG: hypothetical protein DME24_03650 [Verrucomicrobia bacterium]|nr:MAG: hypothetical protein DME24_03650 [Verrucomicrobiota bacterium]
MKTLRPHALKTLAVSLLLSVIASSSQETGSPSTVIMAANNSSSGQDLFVSEANGSVVKISPDGAQSIFAAGMKRPLGLALDRAGNLFVADRFSATIYKFTPDGAGSAFATNIYSPFALAFDSAGNLFATDDDGSVYVFTPDGARSLFASGMQHTSALAFDSADAIRLSERRQEGSVAWGKKPNRQDKWVIFPISRTSRFDATREPSMNSREKLKNLSRTRVGMFVAQQAPLCHLPNASLPAAFCQSCCWLSVGKIEIPVMDSSSQKEIVINGVRYNLAIRLDAHWSYTAEWWNNREYHKHTLDNSIRSDSEAEREAIEEIRKAHLEKEPWLYAEITRPERQESRAEAETQ